MADQKEVFKSIVVKAVEQYKSGQTKIVGFFIGQVMKQLKGKANPASVNKAVNDALENLKED